MKITNLEVLIIKKKPAGIVEKSEESEKLKKSEKIAKNLISKKKKELIEKKIEEIEKNEKKKEKENEEKKRKSFLDKFYKKLRILLIVIGCLCLFFLIIFFVLFGLGYIKFEKKPNY